MGEIADAMINGEMCNHCGTPLVEETGFPSFCSRHCAKEAGMPDGYVAESF